MTTRTQVEQALFAAQELQNFLNISNQEKNLTKERFDIISRAAKYMTNIAKDLDYKKRIIEKNDVENLPARPHQTRVTDAQVIDMRNMRKDTGTSYLSISKIYGISEAQVSKICRGVERENVGGPIEKTIKPFTLTEDQVSTMRTLRAKESMSFSSLGAMFGTSKERAARICRGVDYKDFGGPIENGGRTRVSPINTKVTDAQVAEMRRLRAETGITYKELGSQFGINKTTAAKICKGLQRADAPGPISYSYDNQTERTILTPDEVVELRNMRKDYKEDVETLALMFDISKSTVRKIIKGQSFASVGGPIED